MRDEFRDIARGWSDCDRWELAKKANALTDWVMKKKLTDAESLIYRTIMQRAYELSTAL